jgi:hypothetical protein
MRVPATRRTYAKSPGQTASVCRPGPRPQPGRQESRLRMMKRIALTVSGGCHLLSANALPDPTWNLKTNLRTVQNASPGVPAPASRTPPLLRSGQCQVGCHNLVPDQKHFITYRPSPVKAFRHISGPRAGPGDSGPPRRGGGAPPAGTGKKASRKPCAGREGGPGPPGRCRRRGLSAPPTALPQAPPDNRDRMCSSSVVPRSARGQAPRIAKA